MKVLLVADPGLESTRYWLERARRSGARAQVFSSRPVESANPARLAFERHHLPERLAEALEKSSPDLVITVGLEEAGALMAKARKPSRFRGRWMVALSESDLFWHGEARALFSACDEFWGFSAPDLAGARRLGFKGEAGLLPLPRFTPAGRPSQGRTILLTRADRRFCRALTGLQALSRCAPAARGYRLAFEAGDPALDVAAELLAADSGLKRASVTPRARVVLSLSVARGFDALALRAIANGALPIVSRESDLARRLPTGVILVDPDCPAEVAAALQAVL